MNNDILLQYLLSVKDLRRDEPLPQRSLPEVLPIELTEEREKGGLLEKAFDRVDHGRREKAAAMKPGRAQAASLGAGLLLQLALGEMSDMDFREKQGTRRQDMKNGFPCEIREYTAARLLARLESVPRFSAAYRYGENGKPYFRDYPYYFSLSHSGDYVLCVMSRREVGADIQQWRTCNTKRLAERFFSDQENEVLEQIRRNQGSHEEAEFFFRLWARKEAYGKLTGRGIPDSAGVNLLPGREELPEGGKLQWLELSDFPGYSMAVCRYEQAGRRA